MEDGPLLHSGSVFGYLYSRNDMFKRAQVCDFVVYYQGYCVYDLTCVCSSCRWITQLSSANVTLPTISVCNFVVKHDTSAIANFQSVSKSSKRFIVSASTRFQHTAITNLSGNCISSRFSLNLWYGEFVMYTVRDVQALCQHRVQISVTVLRKYPLGHPEIYLFLLPKIYICRIKVSKKQII